ncbi:MAG: hypothetical protein ACRCUJ_00560 [Phocaeicola sp.]
MSETHINLTKEEWKEELQRGLGCTSPDIAKRINKHRLIIWAWLKGAEIESNSGMGPWYLAKKPLFWYGHKYRIKEKGAVHEEETLDSLCVWGRNNGSDGL